MNELQQPSTSQLLTPLPSVCDSPMGSPMEHLDDALVAEILTFVGPNQFRFVAAVNQKFYGAYLQHFPKKVTYLNASTPNHAKICLYEMDKCMHIFQQPLLCRSAAKHGCLPALQWLHFAKCRWDHRTCDDAARYGHLDVLEWAREHRCSWNAKTTAFAAESRHLNLLKWARSNDCAEEATLCSTAAQNGHLDVLRWARGHGCPWDI